MVALWATCFKDLCLHYFLSSRNAEEKEDPTTARLKGMYCKVP